MKAILIEAVKKIAKWLQDNLPGLVAVGTVVYNRVKGEVRQKENEIQKRDLEIKHLENVARVEKDNSNRSDDDIVNDAIAEGDRIRK